LFSIRSELLTASLKYTVETNNATGRFSTAVQLYPQPETRIEFVYSWTSEPKRLHRTRCRQPWGWKVSGLQRGIPYEVCRDRRS
jgi:hypothetical protein